MKSSALSLAFVLRPNATRKWPIQSSCLLALEIRLESRTVDDCQPRPIRA